MKFRQLSRSVVAMGLALLLISATPAAASPSSPSLGISKTTYASSQARQRGVSSYRYRGMSNNYRDGMPCHPSSSCSQSWALPRCR